MILEPPGSPEHVIRSRRAPPLLRAAAAVLATAAVWGAGYLAGLRLDAHGNYPACERFGLYPCAPAGRAVWQFPAAAAIVALVLLGAIGVLKRT